MNVLRISGFEIGCFFKAAAVIVACAGGANDLKCRKIPNRLTFPAMFFGIVFNLLFRGIFAAGNSLLGILVGFAVFILFALGALKAGDVKLYMAVGAIAGWKFCVNTIVWSILAGGVAAFVVMLSKKNGREGFQNLWLYGKNLLYTRKFYMYEPKSDSSYFSFGCCIAAGTILSAVRYIV